VGTEEVDDSMASACQTQKRDVALDPSLCAYSAVRWVPEGSVASALSVPR
jgi:hypothetical protein